MWNLLARSFIVAVHSPPSPSIWASCRPGARLQAGWNACNTLYPPPSSLRHGMLLLTKQGATLTASDVQQDTLGIRLGVLRRMPRPDRVSRFGRPGGGGGGGGRARDM